MTIILKQIFSLLKLLNSDTGENQIAMGIAMGLILGFSPVLSLQTLLVFVCLFFFRIQMGAAFVAAFFFGLIAYIFDPVCDSLGRVVLEIDALKGLYTSLYNMPIVPFTKFYNSIVMGSFVVAVILFPFVFIASKILIKKYRTSVLDRIKETKFFKAIKATAFFKWYAKYDELYR